MAISAAVFEILTLKAKKSLNFSDLPFFEAPVRGNPLEFGDEIWRQKTRVLGLSDGEEIMPLAFFVLTQHWRVTDRRTDGHVAITITRASIASVSYTHLTLPTNREV